MSTSQSTADSDSTGSSALRTMISAEVVREEQRRQDFRTRSVSLLGVSAGVLTVATGLFTIADKAGTSATTLSQSSINFARAAVASLVLSACFALWINISTHNYVVERINVLSDAVAYQWNEPDWDMRSAEYEVNYLGRLRTSNGQKKWLLDLSIAFQIVGVALVAVTALTAIS